MNAKQRKQYQTELKEAMARFASELSPGTVFSTEFETNCVVVSSPDQFGNFDAIDSDGVTCRYGITMITRIGC